MAIEFEAEWNGNLRMIEKCKDECPRLRSMNESQSNG